MIFKKKQQMLRLLFTFNFAGLIKEKYRMFINIWAIEIYTDNQHFIAISVALFALHFVFRRQQRPIEY